MGYIKFCQCFATPYGKSTAYVAQSARIRHKDSDTKDDLASKSI